MDERLPSGPPEVTPRQREVARLVAEGKSNAEIAEALGISLDGAKYHVSELLGRLGLRRREQIADWYRGERHVPWRHRLRALLGVPLLALVGGGATVGAVAVVVAVAVLSGGEDGDSARAGGGPGDIAGGGFPTQTATPTPTPEWTPAPQPPLAELYAPRPYQELVSSPVREYIPTRIPPPTLEAANAEASIWLGENAYTGLLPATFEGIEGTEERRCVDLVDLERVRSGDFMLEVSQWSAPAYTFRLVPALSSHARLLLRAMRLEDSTDPATHVQEYDGRGTLDEDGSFEPAFVLPLSGKWLVVVTAGPQWGCFIVEAPEPAEDFAAVPSVVAAEAAGAAHASEEPPSPPSPGFTQDRGPNVLGRVGPVGGTPERACVRANDYWDARSGEWVLRPAMQYIGAWDPIGGSKVLLIPLHQPPGLESPGDRDPDLDRLVLTSTLLDDPRHTYVYEAPLLRAYTGSAEAGTLEFSHVTSFVHPREGRWVSIAVQGPNWGCFVFDLH